MAEHRSDYNEFGRNQVGSNPPDEPHISGGGPGAVALGDIIDITGAVTPGENTLDFGILMANGDEYDNLSPVDLLPYTIVSLKLYVYR